MTKARVLRLGLLTASALLTAFHVVLLWGRVADGSVLDPAVAGEWAVGLVLLLGLLRLHRRNASFFKGRAQFTLWLLILVLHAVTVTPADTDSSGLTVDRNLLILAPLGVLVGFAIARTVEGASVAQTANRPRRWWRTSGVLFIRPSSPDLLSSVGPRAPPIFLRQSS